MQTIVSNTYKITIESSSFKALSDFLSRSSYSVYFILCDENTLRHCLPLLVTACKKLRDAEIIEIESGEAAKSLEICAHIWQTLTERHAGKDTLLINLGGGVVSDLGGFTASVYKRGIDFVNIPTSLLAMADASVGGKTGIDFAGIKNSLGTITQPKAVFIFPDFLETLSERHFQNGLAEIYKIALVHDKKFWTLLENGQSAEVLIKKSVSLKNNIVLKDPYDKGIRKILNFGHTLGHAIESLMLETKGALLHGEAIIIGMLLESHIAFQKKLLSKAELNEIALTFTADFSYHSITALKPQAILELVKNDKKTTGQKLNFSLINGIGTCKIDQEVTPAQVVKAIAYYNSLAK